MRYLTILGALLLLAACSGDVAPKTGGDFDLGEPDASNDMGTSSSEVVFLMTNSTDQTLYAGQAAGIGHSCFQTVWLSLIGEDSTQYLEESCERCNCDDTDCSVCAFDCAPEDEAALRLAPGETREFRWDKRFWEITWDGSGQCESPNLASASSYQAQFCFSDQFVAEPQERIGRRLCTEVSFDLADEAVEFEITGDDLPASQTTIVLANDTEQMLYAQPELTSIYCYSPWFSVLSGGEAVNIFDRCEVCNCNVLEQGECFPACPDIACQAPTEEMLELAPGEERRFEWDLTYWSETTVGAQSCELPQYMSGEPLTARICYGTEIEVNGAVATIVDETCEDVSFVAGDPEVRPTPTP